MNKALVCGLTAALLVTGACSTASTTPAAKTTPTSSPATAVVTQTPAPAAGAQDFTLVNATGVEIDKVYIAPHSSDDWEEDILGQDTLADGQTVDIKFNRGEGQHCGT